MQQRRDIIPALRSLALNQGLKGKGTAPGARRKSNRRKGRARWIELVLKRNI